jgi:hypothetical protein
MAPHDKNKEIMVLTHDPVPGYRTVFLVCIALGITYLAIVFANTL